MSKTTTFRWVISASLLGLQCFALHSQDRSGASKATTLAAHDLLNKSCLLCHGVTQTSGLDLRQRLTALKGGKRGPAIVPGRPQESLLYVTAAHLSELKMPPGSDSPLPPEELAILKKWILEGAEWLESDASLQSSSSRPGLADTTGPISDQAKETSLPLTPEFNRDIRSILSDKCFTCHGPDKANRKTALHFDTEEGAFTPLSNGKFAIVRKDPGSSEMYRRITSEDIATRMPPATHKALSVREVKLLRRWIEQGAEWQRHWSFIPVKRPQPPEVKNGKGIRNPVDSFVRSVLEREGLQNSLEADRPTLIRRVTLDLTGLPPTIAEVDAFLNDRSTDAYEKVVDRLLGSPRYGERMTARWLDAARYADTNGYSVDAVRNMWRWRDWVLQSFNQNMPFDQFTVQQLAGDLIPGATRDQVIATGFNRNHRTNGEGGIVEEEFRVEYVADRAETTAEVWLGLTVGCARCHDHKYDPIRQTDYYKFFAYFNNLPERGLVYNYGNDDPQIKAPTPEQETKLAELDERAVVAQDRYQKLQPELAKAQQRWGKWLSISDVPDWSVHDGLVLHYTFDGDLLPQTTGWVNAKATVADAPSKLLSFVEGKLGEAAQFDGKRYIEAGDVANFDYLDPFTLAAWIYPEASNGAIVSREFDYPEAEGYGLYLKGGRLWLHITKRWTDYSLRLQTKSRLELNQWSHVIMTYDGKRKGTGVKLYVNGKSQPIEILFDELNTHLGAKEPFRIGAGGGPQNRFRGYIDDVKVYKRALSEDEAMTLPLLKSVSEIAAIPSVRRTQAEANKLAICFIETAAPNLIQKARREMYASRAKRDEYDESIPTVMVMKEMDSPRQTFVLKRGAYDAPGEEVSCGVPAFLPPLKDEWPRNRLGLARWLVDPSNPLTARVTVNRVWQMFFGVGLVKTVEDFGAQGEWPIHRELLDWLAAEFMESGWNLKSLLRTIVTSATYRQSSKVNALLLERDPENRLMARGPRLRLPAETLRDQALAISGLLVEKLGGPPVKPYQPSGLWEELSGDVKYEHDKGSDLYRRSLYTFWRRTVAPPSMATFDAATREYCSVREGRTNTPLQALTLMNDVTYVEAARKFAERILKEENGGPEKRIGFAFRLATARSPEPEQLKVLCSVFQKFLGRYQRDPQAAQKLLSQGDSPADASLNPAELASYASVASLILNLDQAITKE